MNNQTEEQRLDFIKRRDKALVKVNEILNKYLITLAPYINYSEGAITPTIKAVDAKNYQEEDKNVQEDESKKNTNKKS